MSPHTPGPWVAIAPTIKGAAWRIETHPEIERTLAFVESGQANARLMAAAPDLLGSAIYAMTAIEDVGAGLYPVLGQAMKHLMAAISKAETR